MPAKPPATFVSPSQKRSSLQAGEFDV